MIAFQRVTKKNVTLPRMIWVFYQIEVQSLMQPRHYVNWFSPVTLAELIFGGEIQDYHIGELLVCIIESLTKQITLALKHQASKSENFAEEHYHQEALKLCYEFISKIPQIREFLATDVIAAFDGDPAAKSKDEIIFCYPGVFAHQHSPLGP